MDDTILTHSSTLLKVVMNAPLPSLVHLEGHRQKDGPDRSTDDDAVGVVGTHNDQETVG